MVEIYSPYTEDLAIGEIAGFKLNAWIAPGSWITTEQEPAPGANPKMGDNFTISTAHVFAAGKGALRVHMFPNTAESTGESQGDLGAKIISYKPKIFIKGDNAASLELAHNIVNKSIILWLEKEGDCPGQLVQFGCKCRPCYADAVNNPTGTTGSGKAGWEITFNTTCKFFYNATLTEYPNG